MNLLSQIKSKLTYDYIFYFFIVLFLFSLPLTEGLKQVSLSILMLMFMISLIKKDIKIEFDLINIFLLLHLFFVLIGIFVGINLEESLKQCRDTLRIVFVFLLFRYIDLSKIDFKLIINTIFVSFILTICIGFYYFFTTTEPFVKLNSVGSPNRSAVFISIVFVLSFCLLFIKNKVNKNLLYMTFLFSSLGIILGGSRMAMYTLPLLILIVTYFFKKINLKNIFYFILFVSITISFILLFNENTHLSHKLTKGFSDIHRVQLWLSSIYIWSDHNLFFGIGVGNSIFFNPQDYFSSSVMTYIDNAHNTYLDILLERGILGLITYLGFLLCILISLFKFKNMNNKMSNYFVIGVVLWAMNIIMSFANITFRYEFGLLMVLIFGLLLNKTFTVKNVINYNRN